MTDEEKKAAEIAEAEEKEKANAEFEASLEGLSEEEKIQKIAEKEAEDKEAEEAKNSDYEIALERERERTKAAEKAAASARFKLSEEKRKEKEEAEARGETLEDDKPLTAKELEEILQKDRQQTRKELQSEVIAEKAKKLATSEAEANLIVEIHKNRTFPEGLSLDEQLEEACAIANRQPFMKARKDEIARAQKSKETVSKDSAGTYQEPPVVNEPQMSAAEKKALTGAGFNWDGKRGLFIKTLPDGKKILTFNPKTKKRLVITK